MPVEVQQEIKELSDKIKEQGNVVRQLKMEKADPAKVTNVLNWY
jgi:hypothetical protein